MSTPQGEIRRGRGRPRTPGAEKRIIDAALEEYGEHGWAGFTMDGVARRAGVGKSTVYLRWQDKDSLLTDAVSSRSGDIGDVDTGSLRGDLHDLAANLFRHYRDPAGWAALRVLVDAAGAPHRLGRFVETVADVQVGFVDQIAARAVERGEVPADLPAREIGQCVYGSVTIQTLSARLEGREFDDAEIEERATTLVDVVLQQVVAP
ncbi:MULTISPECIES: TetR/AcrR family transcriptional regulator [unclassified Nocardioides]|uniref:TetR/AcrR family transcriptional regulator n=1 Tax=unclassified Nocardioides TaxID=2615069 RepID=UPI0000EB63BF|nr:MULTISPECIES: TetR/AcrR family transcriptional regulator [unclassified Nocardioides]ABL83655.1 transcriptional regulator, TetR family [Nocardioides sp. JS614]